MFIKFRTNYVVGVVPDSLNFHLLSGVSFAHLIKILVI